MQPSCIKVNVKSDIGRMVTVVGPTLDGALVLAATPSCSSCVTELDLHPSRSEVRSERRPGVCGNNLSALKPKRIKLFR